MSTTESSKFMTSAAWGTRQLWTPPAGATPQVCLGGVDYSGIPGSELHRVILDLYADQHDPMFDDPAYLAYEEELQRRHDEGRDYPIGEMLECYQCPDAVYDMPIMQICTALGPVTNPADPTQTYQLACGHFAI